VKLRIGYRDYVVSKIPLLETATDNRIGQCNHASGQIRVATEDSSGQHPGDEVADTLIHEVLHALWRGYGLSGDREEEEHCVTMLAHGIIALMRNNPAFFPTLESMIGGTIPPCLRKVVT
jgi:hypothetical protein